jgi:hypothetical protein
MAETNPNGANQWNLDPRQKACWNFYTDPTSETFGNATQSAIKAGYTDGTANTITANDWFIGRLWRLNATYTGEKKIKQLMELDLLNGGDKVDVGIARIQADLAKTLVTTQGKNEGYSTKTEVDHTTKGEKLESNLPPEVTEVLKQATEKLKENLSK